MGCVDTESTISTGGYGQDKYRPCAYVQCGGKPGYCYQGDKVQRYGDPRQVAIVTVCFQLWNYLFRRVVGVGTNNPVQDRDHQVADGQGDNQHPLRTGANVQEYTQ